jgi:expansin (peptidoglycan-binding protein)
MDIQALTYNKISNMDTGRISIQYRRVQCVPPKPMVIFVDTNGGQGSWLRMFVEVRTGLSHLYLSEVKEDVISSL